MKKITEKKAKKQGKECLQTAHEVINELSEKDSFDEALEFGHSVGISEEEVIVTFIVHLMDINKINQIIEQMKSRKYSKYWHYVVALFCLNLVLFE